MHSVWSCSLGDCFQGKLERDGRPVDIGRSKSRPHYSVRTVSCANVSSPALLGYSKVYLQHPQEQGC